MGTGLGVDGGDQWGPVGTGPGTGVVCGTQFWKFSLPTSYISAHGCCGPCSFALQEWTSFLWSWRRGSSILHILNLL